VRGQDAIAIAGETPALHHLFVLWQNAIHTFHIVGMGL
jgi:hypothetical protein